MVLKMEVKRDILILLILFYSIFVLGDILTTFWLINFYPSGISGEMNPLAYLIFKQYGYSGMIMSKISTFIIFSIIFIYLYIKYGKVKWFRETLEIILLGLSGLSVLVIINNVFSIIITSYFFLSESPIWLLKIHVFALSLLISILGTLLLFNKLYRVLEAFIGVVLALAPIFFWPALNPILYLTYIVSLSIIISASIYLIRLTLE